MKKNKTYVPQKGSVAARILPIMQEAIMPMVSEDVFVALEKKGGKRVPLSQIGQALFTLSERGLVNRKRKPGKKKSFTYYPLKLPNPTTTEAPDIAGDMERAFLEILGKAVASLLESRYDAEFESRVLDVFNDLQLGTLKQHSGLTNIEMALLLERL